MLGTDSAPDVSDSSFSLARGKRNDNCGETGSITEGRQKYMVQFYKQVEKVRKAGRNKSSRK